MQVIPHHERDQGFVYAVGKNRRGRRYHGDWRHHRRHRIPTVSGGRSPGLSGGRQGEQPLYPCDPCPLSARLLKNINPSPTAFRQGAPGHGRQPGHHRPPLRRALEESIFKKISMFCNVKPDCVIENLTLPVLYEAPIMLEKSNFSSVVCRELGIDAPEIDLTEWNEMLSRIHNRSKTVTIGLVGKYPAARRLSLRCRGAPPRGLCHRRAHLHQVDRFGDHHEGKRRGNAGRLLRRDRPGRLRQSRDRR